MWFVYLLCAICHLFLKTEGTLVSVAVVYRHGDRTPNRFYKNDPYQNMSYWPDGLGQLTNAGKMRIYKLGQWLRLRYASFLPTTYSPEDIWVETGNVDRTIMSALANLAGLYPPINHQVWNDHLPWMPIPIHNRPEDEDAIIALKKPCPKYKRMYKEMLESDYFRKLYKDNKKVFEYLSEKTGQPIKSFKEACSVYTALNIEKGNNLRLPDWVGLVYPEKLRTLAQLHRFSYVANSTLLRLYSGPLLSYLFRNFDEVVNSTSQRKLLMLSGHDSNVVGLLETFGGLKDHYPDFGSTVIVELHQINGIFYMKVWYKTDHLQEVEVLGCPGYCDYQRVRQILKNFTVDAEEWLEECI